MASIKLVLRTQQADATGKAPIYIRLIKDRKAKFVATGVKAKPTEWDEGKQKLKKNYLNSARMNAFLSQKVADAEAQVADHERTKKSVSARKLKEAIKGKADPNFFEYCDNRLEKLKGLVSYRTTVIYEGYIKKFEKFLGYRDFYFSDINVGILTDYATYCKKKLKNSNTTVFTSIRVLSFFYNDAMEEELIPLVASPFYKVDVQKNNVQRLFLNKKQIEELENLDLSQRPKTIVHRDMFLFSVFGGGLRISDVMLLQWKCYDEETQKITKVIQKTQKQHAFRLGAKSIAILNKYKPKTIDPEAFIFPVLENPQRIFTDAKYKTERIANKVHLGDIHLRKMGKEINLPFNLHFHLSRHTFATNALNNGMRIEHVSKLLDHATIQQTQVYAKIVSEELDNAVDKYIN
ncbi:tyrosine-type recombinase/integrase [Leadbetterella sp. DM7]|uniref:tyrosine-type recombinase/integrase n=1 Tax=Leadbetterella sp. DM7 TaxID=3235085 RepID=UPI00349ED984